MSAISVYINKASSNASQIHWEESLRRVLFRSDLNFKYTRTVSELINEIEKDKLNGVDTIISVGGDGTVHTLIQNLVYSDINLLIAPGGTANDLACELNVGKKIKEITYLLRNKKKKKIDLISVNRRFMATNGGIGLASHVVSKINDLRVKYPLFKSLMGKTGRTIYPFMATTELFSSSFHLYDFYIESKEFTGKVQAPLIMVNNQKKFGQSFEIAPYTKNDDGLFNITIFKHKNRLQFAQAMLRFSQGQDSVFDSNIISFETSSAVITNLTKDRDLNFFGDGEVFHKESSEQYWEINNLKKALTVYGGEEICPYATGMEVDLS